MSATDPDSIPKASRSCGLPAGPCSRLSATPETTSARRVNHHDLSLPRYVVDVELAEKLERERDELREKYRIHHEEAERLTQVVRAATVLIAAKGRHNTMLAYEGLRAALSPENTNVARESGDQST